MNFGNRELLLSTTFILLIASAKCCIYSTDLAELGQMLLESLDEIDFTDYDAIEDFKMSVEFAVDSSIVATPEEIHEAAMLTGIEEEPQFIAGATESISKHFNDVFSLLTPYNNYDAQELKNALDNINLPVLLMHSNALHRVFFQAPLRTQRIIKILQNQHHVYHCKRTTSVHQRIVRLHNRALLNLIMGFSTVLYLSKQFHSNNKTIFGTADPSRILRNSYDAYIEGTTNRLNQFTENVSRDIHRCDPAEHEHVKTYIKLDDLVEYYLTSERFLSENGTCSAAPKNYDGVKHNSEVNKYIDETVLCLGTLYKCNTVDLKHLYLYGNDIIYRRYHGFTIADPEASEGETLYGFIGDAIVAYTKDDLNGVGVNSPSVSTLNMTAAELESVKNCPIYGCYCDNYDSPRTIRYFSTKLVTANVENDKVITGLRLVVQDRVVYIQIQTGTLIGVTVVEPITVKWKKIEPVVVTGVDEKSADAEFIKLDYNTRTLYLDDVSSDKGFYLTGVQFVRANGGVRIAAQFTPYNDLSLVLNKEPMKLNISDVNRKELKLGSVLSQDLSQVHSQPISVQNRDYVKFQPSDIENDAGQTTVPFLDVQSVQTIPPTALGGFGIFLKGRRKFGNFVALKLLTPK